VAKPLDCFFVKKLDRTNSDPNIKIPVIILSLILSLFFISSTIDLEDGADDWPNQLLTVLVDKSLFILLQGIHAGYKLFK